MNSRGSSTPRMIVNDLKSPGSITLSLHLTFPSATHQPHLNPTTTTTTSTHDARELLLAAALCARTSSIIKITLHRREHRRLSLFARNISIGYRGQITILIRRMSKRTGK